MNNLVIRSNEYFIKMMKITMLQWNLEKLILFHLRENNVLHLVKEFPYVMYSVRSINGTTRWQKGVFSPELGYHIKYQGEYKKSSYYKNLFQESHKSIDEFYKKFTCQKKGCL